MYLPSLILIYAEINHINNKNPLLESIKWFLLGAITITLIFSAISYIAQGMTFFLFVQFIQTLFFIEATAMDVTYWKPLWKTLWDAKSTWLIYLSSIIGILAILVILLKKKLDDKYCFACFTLIVSFELALLIHLIQH